MSDAARSPLKNREWLDWPESRAVMAALTAGETGRAVARFVGGAVRDGVLGRPVKDVDLATVLTPEEASARLVKAGIKVVPTGIDHGTVTAVVAHRPFEITTLRRDVSTDGRRATVAYTDDWAADAARRDFTMNALYADHEGNIYDPCGGLVDLAAGRVRFIGDAEMRIREDALRILRFFRFHAWYGPPDGVLPDADGLAACERRRDDLKILSAERVATELLRLLAAPDPAPTVRLMAERGILNRIVPEAALYDRLDRVVALERLRKESDPVRRLGSLLPDGAAEVGLRLRLPKRDQVRLAEMIVPREDIAPEKDGSGFGRRLRALLYRLGTEAFVDHALLNWASRRKVALDDKRWRGFLKEVERWPIPAFPLKGRDALALGAKSGPVVGDLLAELELWWIARDFKPTRKDLLARLERQLAGETEGAG
ncbi:MAG: CCA tRNA nucleotidyltransferase [Sphingomonadales bacterium]|nr:CCA tRNA nucleotidyltransferase [Sphingomonadales bacterium]